MSAHRRPEIRFTDAPRGTCRWCGEAILHGEGPKQGRVDYRRRWHPACVDEYNASDPRELRRRIRKRDKGVCRACGLDTRKLSREVRGRGRRKRLRELGFKARGSLWELDHIVPLIDGGGHEPENLQTLCVPCHLAKSAEENRLRAQARGPDEKAPPKPRVERREAEPDLDALLHRADEANARVEAFFGD